MTQSIFVYKCNLILILFTNNCQQWRGIILCLKALTLIVGICLIIVIVIIYFMNKTNEALITTPTHQPNSQPEYQHNQVNSQDLQLKIKQLQFNLQIAQQRCARLQRKEKQYELHVEQVNVKKKETQFRLLQEIKQLKISNKRNEASYQKLKKELELVKIVQKEKNRITISAAIHNSQQQLQKTKLQIEQEFLNQCEELKMEMKQKEDKMILTLKKLRNFHNNDSQHSPQQQQYTQIIQFIKDIDDIEELNATVHKLKAEILNCKRQNQLLQHQAQSLQFSNNQCNQKINDLICNMRMLQSQRKQFEEQVKYLKNQLEQQKMQNNQLQSYYSQKWVKQFQIFRMALQKVYQSKLIQLKDRFEEKVASINTSQQKYINLHKQDQQVICTLQHQIVVLSTEIKASRQVIVKLQTENTEIKQELQQTQKVMQTQAIQKYNQIITEKQQQIEELRQEVVVAIKSKQLTQNKMIRLNKNLKEKFEVQKKNLENKHVKEKEEIIKEKQQQIQKIIAKHQIQQVKQKSKEQSLKHQLQYQISQLQTRTKKQSSELNKLLQQSRSQAKQIHKQFLRKQKMIGYQMEQLKKACAKELDKMKKQMQQKNNALKCLHQRLKHDQNVKRELRYLYDIKIKEYGQLVKQNQSLTNTIAEKENQINQLNHTITKNNWQNTLKELKNQFAADLLSLSEIHWKQIQHFRNKIYELQSILCKTYLQDQQKIDSLFNHNSMLQTKLQLMKRRYTEESYSSFIQPSSTINFIQPRKNLFVSKRKKRANFAFSQSILKKTKQNSTAAAIVRMKRFLQRGKSTDIYDKSGNTEKCITNTSPISRKHVYISTQR